MQVWAAGSIAGTLVLAPTARAPIHSERRFEEVLKRITASTSLTEDASFHRDAHRREATPVRGAAYR